MSDLVSKPDGFARDKLLSLVLDEAPHAIIVTNEQWKVLIWGRAAEAVFGWEEAEAVGRDLDDLTCVGGKTGSHRMMEITEGDPVGAREVVLRRHKDGRLMQVEVAWRAVREIEGGPCYHVATKRDVSKEQLKRDLDLVQDRYQDVLDSVPDAIIVATEVGSIVLFNAEAARLFGASVEEMLGQQVERLIPDQFARGHARHREGYVAEPRRREMGSGQDLRARKFDGSEFPVEVSLSPLSLSGRGFVMATVRDLTDRVRLEEVTLAASEAQQASSAKTEFLSRMSHELRTPLNAIIGFAQLLEMGQYEVTAQTRQKQIRHILWAGEHLLGMMNDLLDVTRIETGALSLSMEPVIVRDLVEEVVVLCHPAALEGGVGVECAVQDAKLAVRADRLRLRQVLLNLVSNAIKYNRVSGRVVVSAESAEAEVKLMVMDTGIGMSAVQLERLYRPFERLGAEAGTIPGNGIGLTIAKGMVQAMGGKIEVCSEKGVGTTFEVRLKRASLPKGVRSQEQRRAAATAIESKVETVDQEVLRAVYVEDNEANIEVLKAVMRLRPQWRLEVCTNGKEAVAAAARSRPDLLIVDMHLPDTSGLELARKWDAMNETRGIPRVALSADATELRTRAAADYGFTRYFTKPIDIRTFLAWIDEFTEQLLKKRVTSV